MHDIVGISPLRKADANLVAAVCRAGALGVLDLGHDSNRALTAIRELDRLGCGPFGVRVRRGLGLEAEALPPTAEVVILDPGAEVAGWGTRTVWVQVVSLEEAKAAVAAGANGLIAKGTEAGGRIGTETAFVLLQQLMAAVDAPVWVQGGIGLHTAAAAIAGGARGVVLDAQLALVRESGLKPAVRQFLSGLDGSETVVIGGHRVLTRPDFEITRKSERSPQEVAALLGGDDPRTQLLPCGQDGALAHGFAKRFLTAGRVVHAIRESIREHLDQASALRPLAPGAPLAESLGVRYPVLQGPMTRVSDRPEFIEAVAEAGALPFLALSLVRGKPLDELVEQTASLLGNRPWGVGILGFVPPEVREEQLAVIERTRPPYAIIAGGRPSQARSLEDKGIHTFLHVPSPGLLESFLKDGTRRFIFEGQECGGHVGPRTSFNLWEQQLQLLCGFQAPEELSVVFAGGIHDARSAAMVSAMAATLAAKGARIGVLMGTGYLFTREAVATGAILEPYQKMAIECTRTILLETAPGHATRCVESGYVASFRKEKERLEREGRETREVWSELETLNLGRLRMASKGLRREGSELLSIDEDEQRREGMYMIGQLAALRDRVVTMRELHEEVCEGATEIAATWERVADERAHPVDIAIIGMAGVFPKAPNLDTFWSNILSGVDAIREVDPERWNPEIYCDPDGTPGKTTPTANGGFLDDLVFDPARYGIPPNSMAAIDPVQLLSLDVARRALEDAGYPNGEFDRENTSVVFGAEGGSDITSAYSFRAFHPQYLGEIPEELDYALPVFTEDTFPGVLANVIAGRIANRLDLGGMNYTVDAACASALAAVEAGVQTLVAGTSNMVLAGGADLHNSINDYLLFSGVRALSKNGRCRAFDSQADGIVLGEGIGVVVLKRLADAERDGDRIYGVIRAIAGSSDGRHLGLTAPRTEGQMRALHRAYDRGGVGPESIGLMEAHGTGTVVGDRTELLSMERVFKGAGVPPSSCYLGSIKSQIGHTKCTAGIASLMKVTLALHHGVVPPTLHIEEPNSAWVPGVSPFGFTDRAQPWVSERDAAALSSFGFGGTNFHAVVQRYEDPLHPVGTPIVWPAELFLVHGEDEGEAMSTLDLLEGALQSEHPWSLGALAKATARYGKGPVQYALVARSTADLEAKISMAREGRSTQGLAFRSEAAAEARGRMAFLFPGQGSQQLGMGGDLYLLFPELRELLAKGRKWATRIFPPRTFSPEDRKEQELALRDTRAAQPALGITSTAFARVLHRLGLRPDMAAGHSFGELAALSAAGAFDFETLLALSEARAEAILAAAGDDPGTMAAVAATPEQIEPFLAAHEGVVLANRNSPRQAVISGPTAGVERALEDLAGAGFAAKRLPVACAFHSGVVAGAGAVLKERLESSGIGSLEFPVWSNVTAAEHARDGSSVAELLARQVGEPVRFQEQIEGMYEAGARVFVEVGPGGVLSALVHEVLGDRPHVCVTPGRLSGRAGDGRLPGLEALLEALGELATNDVSFDASALFAGRALEECDLASAADRQLPATAWLISGFKSRPARGELPASAMHPIAGPIRRAPSFGGIQATERDTAILEYLRNVREMAETQHQIMLGYLGQPVPPRAAAPQPLMRESTPARAEPTVKHEVAAEPEPREQSAAPARGVRDALLAIVSEKTGYPPEMLDLELDIEADLSIDSIKRIEIISALQDSGDIAGLSSTGEEEVVEELAGIRTLGGMIRWIEERIGVDSTAPAAAAREDRQESEGAATAAASPDDGGVERYVCRLQEIEPATPNGDTLTGKRFGLTNDGRGVAEHLASLLEARGATVEHLNGEATSPLDGLVHLGALNPDSDPDEAKHLFRLAKKAAESGAEFYVGATALGGTFGLDGNGASGAPVAGLAGLLKTLAKEQPEAWVRSLDFDPKEDSERIAELLMAEICAADTWVEVGYANGKRHRIAPEATRLAGSEGAGDGRVELGESSVVLLTGGARGITAQIGVELARRYRCRLELVGRTDPDAVEESAATRDARDARELRQALITSGEAASPAEAEAETRRILTAREVRGTLEAIRKAGGEARYHVLDVRDTEGLKSLVAEIYASRGRLDGIIHGAGIIEDKLIKHKTLESFERVYDTKVKSALAIAEAVRPDLGFLVFFSSVSGVFGNRGQADYAAANDQLDKLAHRLSHKLQGRVVAIDWGPWQTGMITEELEREYARRGIGLIPTQVGIARLIDELTLGADAQVIVANADLAQLA